MSEEQSQYTPSPSPATQSLDAYLDSFKPEVDGELVDQQDADWALRKIGHIEASMKRDEADAEEAIYRISTWLRMRQESYENAKIFFKRGLAAFLQRTLTGKAKSIKLMNGTIGHRSQGPSIVKDDDALLQWVYDAGLTEFIKVKESVDWAELKKCLDLKGQEAVFVRNIPFDPYGEVIACISVEQQPDKFYATPVAMMLPAPRDEVAIPIIEAEVGDD